MHIYTTPYRYEEYPKWVRGPDGKDTLVRSVDEECAVTVQIGIKRGRGRSRQSGEEVPNANRP